MEGFLTDLGKTFAEKLINRVIEKSRYLFCFKCIAKEFDLEKDKLEAERKTIRQRFEVAIERDKDIQCNAIFWEEQVDKLIQEDTKTNQSCFFGFCPNCIWRYKRGEELANKIEEIKKLVEKGEKFENIELARRLPDVERYSSQYYISFQSRELKYKELLEALKDDSHYIIGLHGMGGTGKTTLAKEAGKQLKASMQFNRVIIITVSNTPNIIKIQDDIAGPLGLEWKDVNASVRPIKLWSRLTNGEKILVILDDVWDYLNFDDIGIPDSDHRKGCKVLVTTRYRWVCDKMSCGITIQLELLSEEDAWDMFERHADLSVNSSKGLLKQGRKIAKECKGLPVAIATIASSLRGKKGQAEWDVALKSLQNPMSMGGVEEDLDHIYKCLKFSYDNLTDKKAKELFLLCSVFHEDEEISTETLSRLGIGVGLFGEGYGKYNDARNRVDAAKNKLLDSCLLLKTNKGDVKMHDLIREVAQWIANKEILVVDSSNKNQMSSVVGKGNIKYLLFEGNSMDLCSSSGFDGSKLEILIFIVDKCCFVDSFLENIAGLRVLNLIAVKDEYSRVTLSLPQSIQSLTNIRSLLIERVELGDISVLGSLQSLDTLDLKSCEIEELPQEIAEIKKLRLLNLENCSIYYNNPFEVIQRCPSLEELYFVNSLNLSREIIITLPPALERYQLIEWYGEMMYDFSISKHVSLQQDYFSEATFNYVIQTAEILKLAKIKKEWKNLMPEIVGIDEGMNDLIELHLELSSLQCLVDTEHIGSSQVPNVFSKLVVLKLSSNYHLKELFNGPISSDSLNNLKSVTLGECPKLVSVFDLSTCQSLLLLESLEISDCGKLENIFTNDNNKSCNSLFPKLKVVHIEKCPQLQFIFPLFSAKDLLLLETIQISYCDNLKHIFGQHQNVELAFLKELQLKYVPNFIDIFPESCHSIYKPPQTELDVEEPIKSNKFPWSHVCCYGSSSSSSSSTSNKIPMPSVHVDQPQHCSISLESYCFLRLSHVMCNIKVIELNGISRIKSMFTLSVAQKMWSLESLTIWNCDELDYIVVDIGDGNGITTGVNIVFPKLKQLEVCGCKKLEYIFGHINASDHHRQNHLHLPALISLEFTLLPSLIDMGTKNYHTMLSRLEVISIFQCPQVANESIGDFVYPMSKSQDSTTIKDLSGNDLEAHLASEDLKAQEINLGLQSIDLFGMARMTCLFAGPKNCFSLQNLESIKISQCKKLEIIFTTCVLKCLPQLVDLIIGECDELKYIIEEDDDENKEISNVFPKLRSLVVRKCNKLKYVFPAAMCADLTELLFLWLQEAANLEKIFGGSEENDQKVGIPNLLILVFFDLPCFFVGIQFQTVQHRLVEYCQKHSLTSSSYTDLFFPILMNIFEEHKLDHALITYVWDLKKQLEERYESDDTSGGNLNGTEIQSSNLDSQCLKEKEDQSIEEGSTSETRNDPSMQLVDDLKQKGIKLSVEDGITSANSSGPSATSSLEYGDGQTVAASPPIAITKPLTTQDVDVNKRKETTISLIDDSGLPIEHPTPSMLPRGDPSLLDEKVIKMKPASEAKHEFDRSSSIATKKGFSERFAQLNNKQYLGLSVAVVGISVVAGFLYLRKK